MRSAEEILSTLDENGTLGGMPFMPEMLQFCGLEVPLHRRADKTCDTTHSSGLRRLHDTVHLTGLRCDGSAHGGCQAGCLLYWNERWLRRVDDPRADRPVPRPPNTAQVSSRRVPPGAGSGAGGGALSPQDLARLTAGAPGADGSERYVCQATAVFSASTPLPWWEPSQYVRDIVTGNASIREVLTGIFRWLSVRVQWRVNRSGVPFVKGRLTRTPTERLDLQPGDRVRIKSRREIEATLDTDNRNRGLRVDADMMLFCGREFPVLRRVSRIIDERTGRMTNIPGDCIVLDGATCTGQFNRCCPRSDYPYWREIWLTRVGEPSKESAGVIDSA